VRPCLKTNFLSWGMGWGGDKHGPRGATGGLAGVPGELIDTSVRGGSRGVWDWLKDWGASRIPEF
jgi:hypothetical protein